jgi:hypothetical protein
MRFAAPSVFLLAALALLGGCSEGLENVELGDIRCLEPCRQAFLTVDPTRGDNNSELKITIQNIGRGELDVTNVYLENTSTAVRFGQQTVLDYLDRGGWTIDASGHTFTRPDPIVLSRDALLEVELVFGPAPTAGSTGCPNGNNLQCGFVVIESNDIDAEGPLRIPIELLIGSGRISITPSVINFPEPQVGRTFTETFTVSNTGTGILTVTAITNPEPSVRVESNSLLPLPIQVPANGTHVFDVSWTPTTTDALNANVLIQSDTIDGAVAGVALRSGAGDVAAIDVTPCDIVFDEPIVGEPNEVTFDVSNTGGAAMTWSMTLGEYLPTDARPEFQVQRAGAVGDVQGPQEALAPGNTRTYTLVYTPTADRSVSGSIRFTGNFGTSRSCSFRAGPASPEIEVDPRAIFWGGVAMGESSERSFVITNNGRAALEIASITLSESGDVNPEFSLEAGVGAGFSVPTGGSRRVLVTFTRAAVDVGGADSGTVTITHNDPLVTAPVLVQLEANHDDAFLPPTCDVVVSEPEPYTVGQTVSLDGRGSSNADGTTWATPERFQWTLEVPAGSTAELSTEFGDTTSLTFDAPGTYSVALIATAEVSSQAVSCELVRNLLVVAP